MSSIVDRQIRALRESVVELAEKGEPDAFDDVQELVTVGLMVYDALQSMCDCIDKEVAAGKRCYDVADARAVWQRFVGLHDILRSVSRTAAHAEGSGRKVEGVERLEQAVVEAGLIASVSPDRADAAAGRNSPTKTMAEVRGDLRRRMRA